MNKNKRTIILGSGSKQRLKLLKEYGWRVTRVIGPCINEFETGRLSQAGSGATDPRVFVQAIGNAKLEAVVTALPNTDPQPIEADFTDLVLVADTIVVNASNEIVGKPSSIEEACEMVKKYQAAGRCSVMTSLNVCCLSTGMRASEVVESTLEFPKEFVEWGDNEIHEYVTKGSNACLSSSGGLMMEYIPNIICHGSKTNVLGLPMETLNKIVSQLNQSNNVDNDVQ